MPVNNMPNIEEVDQITSVVEIVYKSRTGKINFAQEISHFTLREPARNIAAGGAVKVNQKRMPCCPACQGPVKITPVNVSRCTNIGGPWKSSIECLNKTCRYTELSIKPMNDWRK